MFGWSKGEAMDMGEMGSYQLFSQAGSTSFDGMSGGLMALPKEMPAPLWLFYFVVPDIDAATAKVKAGGGTVMNGPMEEIGRAHVRTPAPHANLVFRFLLDKKKQQ